MCISYSNGMRWYKLLEVRITKTILTDSCHDCRPPAELSASSPQSSWPIQTQTPPQMSAETSH